MGMSRKFSAAFRRENLVKNGEIVQIMMSKNNASGKTELPGGNDLTNWEDNCTGKEDSKESSGESTV